MLGFVGFVEHPNGITAIVKVSHQQTLAEGNEKAKRGNISIYERLNGAMFLLKENE